jgi:hypothetical protein
LENFVVFGINNHRWESEIEIGGGKGLQFYTQTQPGCRTAKIWAVIDWLKFE